MSYCVDKGISHSEWLSWPAEARAKTLAYLIEQAEVCQLCGTAEWEWEDNRFAYTTQEKFCQGCYYKEVASEDAGKLPGTTVDLVPNTPQFAAKQQLMAEKRRRMMELDEEE